MESKKQPAQKDCDSLKTGNRIAHNNPMVSWGLGCSKSLSNGERKPIHPKLLFSKCWRQHLCRYIYIYDIYIYIYDIYIYVCVCVCVRMCVYLYKYIKCVHYMSISVHTCMYTCLLCPSCRFPFNANPGGSQTKPSGALGWTTATNREVLPAAFLSAKGKVLCDTLIQRLEPDEFLAFRRKAWKVGRRP